MEKARGTVDYQIPPTVKIEEDEIDLAQLFSVIWKRKVFLIAFVFIVTSSVALYTLTLPNIYRVEVVILPTKPPSESKLSGLSNFAGLLGLAEMAGVSLPVSFNVAEIKARLNSKIFYEYLINKYNLMPILFSEEWDEEQKRWKDLENPPTIDDGIRVFKNIVKVSEDRKTGTITIAVEFKDPEQAARLAELIVKELKNIMIKDTIERAQNTLKELKKSLHSSTDPLIQQKIYNLIANQIETISLAKVSESFAFKIIDPPRVPDKKYKPKRALIVAVTFVSSLFLGIFLVFFKEYIDNVRKNAKKEGEREDEKNKPI